MIVSLAMVAAVLAGEGPPGAASGPAAAAPALVAPTTRRRSPDPAALRAAFAGDPPVDALRRAATALALAEPERALSLVGRARWAALLPELRVRVDRHFKRAESVDLVQGSFDTPPPPVGIDTDNDVRYDCRATWDLSRLVFNPDELAASAQALRTADARREIESLVIRLYFERRRLKAEALAVDVTDMASAFRLDLRVQEIEAELDALTGGAYTRLGGFRAGEPSPAVP